MKENHKSDKINISGNNRRDFLKKTAFAGISAALLPVAGAAEKLTPESYSENQIIDSDFTITILITTDIHAQLNTHDEFFWENEKPVYRKRGGLAVLKTMIEKLRSERPENTILYDGGDFFHGHGVASLTEGKALIPLFNNLGYDVILPGNWEVVYKKKQMLYDMGHSNAAKICANMFHAPGSEAAGELVYHPYWIKYISGVKIGIIGYTDHLIPKRQSPAYSEGLTFEHAEKSIARYVSFLRDVEGCEVVLVATHMGLAQQIGLADNPASAGVDLIMGADTHERVRVPIQAKYTKVIECGAFGSFLGKLDLRFQKGKFTGMNYSLLDVDPELYPADQHMQKMVDEVYEPFKTDLQKIIGTSTTPLVRYYVIESPMDNVITDAIMWKFKPDIALSNGFRFCQPLNVDSKTGLAQITKEFLWNMLPVNSEVKSGVVTGAQLIEWLEKELHNAFAKDPSKRFGGWVVRFNGMIVNFTIGNELGKRVNKATINGMPVNPVKEYTIIACEREGDPDNTICRMDNVKNPTRLKTFMHDVIEQYLAAKSPIAPRFELRASATDAPQTLLTQLSGTTYEFR